MESGAGIMTPKRDDAATATSHSAVCPFLRLPREVRNNIYGYTTISVHISERDYRTKDKKQRNKGWHPAMTLANTTDPALLLVNHQVHDEYVEHIHSRSNLVIKLSDSDLMDVQTLDLKPGVQPEALSGMKDCLIWVPWSNITRGGFAQVFQKFLVRQMTGQALTGNDVKETPSSG